MWSFRSALRGGVYIFLPGVCLYGTEFYIFDSHTFHSYWYFIDASLIFSYFMYIFYTSKFILQFWITHNSYYTYTCLRTTQYSSCSIIFIYTQSYACIPMYIDHVLFLLNAHLTLSFNFYNKEKEKMGIGSVVRSRPLP